MTRDTFPLEYLIKCVTGRYCWRNDYANASSEAYRILSMHLPSEVGFLDVLDSIDKISATEVHLESFNGVCVRSGPVSDYEAEWVLMTLGLHVYGFDLGCDIGNFRDFAHRYPRRFVFEDVIAKWDYYAYKRSGLYLDKYYKAIAKIVFENEKYGIRNLDIYEKMAELFPEEIDEDS